MYARMFAREFLSIWSQLLKQPQPFNSKTTFDRHDALPGWISAGLLLEKLERRGFNRFEARANVEYRIRLDH